MCDRSNEDIHFSLHRSTFYKFYIFLLADVCAAEVKGALWLSAGSVGRCMNVWIHGWRAIIAAV